MAGLSVPPSNTGRKEPDVLPPEAPTYTIEQAARLLGISRNHAYHLVRTTGRLAGVKVLKLGKLYRVPRAALDTALAGDAA
jgi:excisionase family DNA binding protein